MDLPDLLIVIWYVMLTCSPAALLLLAISVDGIATMFDASYGLSSPEAFHS